MAALSIDHNVGYFVKTFGFCGFVSSRISMFTHINRRGDARVRLEARKYMMLIELIDFEKNSKHFSNSIFLPKLIVFVVVSYRRRSRTPTM